MSEKTPPSVIREESLRVLFVHSDVDDFGLNPQEFRIYAHLARRADRKMIAFPHVQTIAEHCLIGRTKTIEALASLAQRGMIEKRKYEGFQNRAYYVITPREQWKNPPESLESSGDELSSKVHVANLESSGDELSLYREEDPYEGDPEHMSDPLEKRPIRTKTEITRPLWLATTKEGRGRSSQFKVGRAWSALKKKPPLEEVLKCLEAWARTKAWQEGFAPGLHRWIADRKFADFPEEEKPESGKVDPKWGQESSKAELDDLFQAD